MAPDARREQLVNQALRIVEKAGVEGLSLAALAEQAAVSRQVPYIYFEGGVTEVVGAVAEQGFRELIAELLKSSGRNPRAALVDLALRYVEFGVGNDELYRAMFHPSLAAMLKALDSRSARRHAGHATYGALASARYQTWCLIEAAVADLKGEMPEPTAANPESLAMAAMLHGLVDEYINEKLGPEIQQKTPAMIDVIVRGIERRR